MIDLSTIQRIENFRKCCHSIPEMGKHIENGINIDPIPLTIEEFAVAGNIDGKVRFIEMNTFTSVDLFVFAVSHIFILHRNVHLLRISC